MSGGCGRIVGATPPETEAWRLGVLVRVCALALVVGQLLTERALLSSLDALVTLIALAVTVSVLDRTPRTLGSAWHGPVEGAVTAGVVLLVGHGVEPLLVVLGVPVVLAGLRRGFLAAVLTWAGAMTAGAAAYLAAPAAAVVPGEPGPLVLWTVVGLGAGLLAATRTRSRRAVLDSRAPHAAAHQLVEQLHGLVHERGLDVDVDTLARELQATARDLVGADRSSLWVLDEDGTPRLLSSIGRVGEHDEAQARSAGCGRPEPVNGLVSLPLSAAGLVFGALVLQGPDRSTRADAEVVRERLGPLALRLDTALLAGSIRSGATHEERQRLARELHDGLAQRTVAIGYLAEELVDLADSPELARTAEELRDEVANLTREMRSSVLDLHHDLVGDGGVADAIGGCVRRIAARRGLRVHVLLEETGPRLAPELELQVLRIAQEAVANVDRHARASTLWLTLRRHGCTLRLEVEDDGIGGAAPRPGHLGLESMRQRARQLGGDLTVVERLGGGTSVVLVTPGDHRETITRGDDRACAADR